MQHVFGFIFVSFMAFGVAPFMASRVSAASVEPFLLVGFLFLVAAVFFKRRNRKIR